MTPPALPAGTPTRAIALLALAGFASQAMVRASDSLLPQIATDFGVTIGTAAIIVTVCLAVRPAAQRPRYDVVIANGRIVDGTGAPWFRGDVAIAGDRACTTGSAMRPRMRVAPVMPSASLAVLIPRGAPRAARRRARAL